jgi:cytidine deaminase
MPKSKPKRSRDFQGQLIRAATEARDYAQAPYSGFRVGAALAARGGEIVTGCNIESASYGLTVCAERVALFKALSQGLSEFTHLAVVADTDTLTAPCGACRQLLWEYGGNLTVVLADLHTGRRVLSLRRLLPLPFEAQVLPIRGRHVGGRLSNS